MTIQRYDSYNEERGSRPTGSNSFTTAFGISSGCLLGAMAVIFGLPLLACCGCSMIAFLGSPPSRTSDVSFKDLAPPVATQLARKESPPVNWFPRVGEVCTVTSQSAYGKETKHLFARNYIAFERLVKFTNAIDSVGIQEMIDNQEVVWLTTASVTAKVIALNERSKTAEMRIEGDSWKAIVPGGRAVARPDESIVVFQNQLSPKR